MARSILGGTEAPCRLSAFPAPCLLLRGKCQLPVWSQFFTWLCTLLPREPREGCTSVSSEGNTLLGRCDRPGDLGDMCGPGGA